MSDKAQKVTAESLEGLFTIGEILSAFERTGTVSAEQRVKDSVSYRRAAPDGKTATLSARGVSPSELSAKGIADAFVDAGEISVKGQGAAVGKDKTSSSSVRDGTVGAALVLAWNGFREECAKILSEVQAKTEKAKEAAPEEEGKPGKKTKPRKEVSAALETAGANGNGQQ